MGLVTDIKADIRFLLDSGLPNDAVIDAIIKLYKDNAVTRTMVTNWIFQIHNGYKIQTVQAEDGPKTIKRTINIRKGFGKKNKNKKKGFGRAWHDIVIGGTVILATRNIKAVKASISATKRFMQLIDDGVANPEEEIIKIVNKEYRKEYTLSNKNDILTKFKEVYLENRVFFLVAPDIAKAIASGRDIDWVARKYKTTKEDIISAVKKFSYVFFVFYELGALPFIEEVARYGKTDDTSNSNKQ